MSRVSNSALGLALVLCMASAAWAQQPPKGLSSLEIRGDIGPYPIGLNVTLRDYSQVVSAHYFYVSRLADIPLSARTEGEAVRFEEPGGGGFLLHLTSNGPARGYPLTFYNSTGLKGTWTQGGRTLPVTLHFESGDIGPPSARWYSHVTNESDAVFEARVRRFLRAAMAGDKDATAREVSYPLRVNAARRLTVRTKAELLAHWDEIFTPKLTAELRKAVPHEMFVHEYGAMLGDGEVWFDAKGATSINAR